MGFDYDPELIYGFAIKKVRIYDELIGWSYPNNYCHSSNEAHFFGPSLKFTQYKRRQIPEHVKRFGELMLEHFGIKCHYYMVQGGDVCDDCDSPTINFLAFCRLMKPEWTTEECLELIGKFANCGDAEECYEDADDFDKVKKTLDWNKIKAPFHCKHPDDNSDVEACNDKESDEEVYSVDESDVEPCSDDESDMEFYSDDESEVEA